MSLRILPPDVSEEVLDALRAKARVPIASAKAVRAQRISDGAALLRLLAGCLASAIGALAIVAGPSS